LLKSNKYQSEEMKEPLVSIVTPVYNSENFFEECIDSVLSQSYQNWEYIIVDDCSTDRTVEIAKHFADLDKRIKLYVNDENLGHFGNGNYAFTLMSDDSKYCKVIHADDWLFPDCLTRMVEVAVEYPKVGIVSSYRLDGNRVGLDGLPYPSNHIPGKEIARNYLLHGAYYFGSPSSLLIRSDLIKKRKSIYNPEHLHSDGAACLDFLTESDFGFVHQVLTYTRRHDESVTSRLALKFHSHRIGPLQHLIDYGRVFLNDEEYRDRLKTLVDFNHRELAKDIVRLRSKELFMYHYNRFKEMNIKIRPFKLFFSILLYVYSYIHNKLRVY
jgi:glycosyltransferase involved in cell wall biosynthesis